MSTASILQKILAQKTDEVRAAKRQRDIGTVRAMAEGMDMPVSFFDSIAAKDSGPRIIAECKRKSPSKGQFVPNYDPTTFATAYERGGAAAISVLTDEMFFGGHLSHLQDVSDLVSIPVLRKDFIIDEYQIYEARVHGASSYLLIAGVLRTGELQYFTEIGRDLGMEPLIECHSQEEVELALKTDGKVIGINNRNLNDFSISLDTSIRLAKSILAKDSSRVLVCESGVRTREDIAASKAAGMNAFLIGEFLMTHPRPDQALMDLRS
jgi:indole-3-glycerol phosphate synthase